MGFINLADKTICAKLVYYGVGMGGKTTSLQHVHTVLCPKDEVQLVSINTEDDSTLLFDFLPIDLGQIETFKIRIQGFTVPGQPKYKRMRRYVLQGADAVVFVVDSQRSRLEENQQSLLSLKENLSSNGLDPETTPIVLQYNKRDLDDILPEGELDEAFAWREGVSSFPSVAREGHGVFETFVHAAGQIVESKVLQYGLGRRGAAPETVAEGARAKLWELHDQGRDDRGDGDSGKVQVTVPDWLSDGKKADQPEPEVLSDDDLNPELFAAPDGTEVATDPVDEDPERLLDDVIRTNVELAEHFGELDRYKGLLERRNRELVEIAQNTVHDLNRPLSVVKLMLSSLRQGLFGELEKRGHDAVDNGLLAIQQMEKLVHELLDSSRLDDDGVQLHFQETDATLIVADVVRTLRFEIDQKDVCCRIEPLPTIAADTWALSKAFMNLVGNALQYTHPERRPRISVRHRAEGDQHVFEVEDNGIGIPAEDLPRLFKRFERGSNTGCVSGTGLGLHIVREVALGHGGQVWVESEEGEWTRFSLSIPFEPVMPPRSMVASVQD